MASRLAILLLPLFITLYLSGCSGCSRSGSHQPKKSKRNTPDQTTSKPKPTSAELPKPTLKQIGSGPTEVAMEKDRGVYKVPVTVNGVPMKFILDTGASLISISATEAEFMFKQGAITDTDIIGQSKFQDANGDISPGDVIRLKSVQIGDRVLENVTANVVRSTKAPLLLGQSALSQFGKISVDYRRNIVTFD
ncbi:retropepsin-like aspartic protease family protein [Spirosoma validum]|uniref:Retroviral-like aspartic protease family protein n=1 Tax=Spirosoma validum TaxID=2771355 RepID=A0A927B6A1_9BACT|nr:retroviral-like aspartic protease family protein [Spirosoma validum]MBD2755967.1 retroviral-like aspartic protease family protein [Spirosoma validum]